MDFRIDGFSHSVLKVVPLLFFIYSQYLFVFCYCGLGLGLGLGLELYLSLVLRLGLVLHDKTRV